MKPRLFLLMILFLASRIMAPYPVFGEDQTILLDESVIKGVTLDTSASSGHRRRVAGPALSTSLRWDGEQIRALDIPKEILDHLTQSDLSFFKNREFDADELDDESDLSDNE